MARPRADRFLKRMSRRSRLLIVVLVGAVGLFVAWQSPLHSYGVSRPVSNIVFFLTDDQRYDMLEFMPIVQRELVSRGINFSEAYVTTPLCCPSRASILTGLYSHHHGVLANRGTRGGWRGFDDNSTVATWLQASGTRTMLLGKYLNLYGSFKVPPGWDEWFAIWDNGQKYYDYSVNINGEVRQFTDKERHYSTDILARQAVKLLQADTERPFFMYLAFDGPHAPAIPAKQDIGTFANLAPLRLPSYNEVDVTDKPDWIQQLAPLDPSEQADIDKFRRDQVETLQSIDRAVGSVVQALRDSGRLDNTWLMFMSDNGLSLGEHRYGQHKSCGYEECIRVPLVVVPPASQASAFGVPRTDDRLVLNIDLAPTWTELAGTSPASPIDGMSLVSMLANSQSDWRTEAGLELLGPDEEDGVRFQGIRSGQWKYIRYLDGEQELYDLQSDPFEMDSLASDSEQASRITDLASRMDALMR